MNGFLLALALELLIGIIQIFRVWGIGYKDNVEKLFSTSRELSLVTCSPSASQLLAFSPGKEQAAGVWET